MLTTLIFVVIHLYNIQGMVNVFTGAIWYALCYYYTENIFYTITAHMLHNLFSMLDLSSLYKTVNGFSILHMQRLVLAEVIFAVCVVLFEKTFSKAEYKERQEA